MEAGRLPVVSDHEKAELNNPIFGLALQDRWYSIDCSSMLCANDVSHRNRHIQRGSVPLPELYDTLIHLPLGIHLPLVSSGTVTS